MNKIVLGFIIFLSILFSACSTSETAQPTVAPLVSAPQPVVGFYTATCHVLVEDAVDQAYKLSLITNGYSEAEAQEYRSMWATFIPNLEVVVKSPERGIEIFRGARAFQAVAIGDPYRYSECLVAISADPQKGSEGYRLTDYVNSQNSELTIYQWGPKDNSYGVVIVEPTDASMVANILYR
jgi:hypothetical protein